MTLTKKRRASADMTKLKKLLENVSEDRQPIANSIYTELLFIEKTLAALRDHVQTKGPVENFEQGKQKFLRESPALKAYNTTIQRYSLLYKQLVDLLPDSAVKETDELLDFLGK